MTDREQICELIAAYALLLDAGMSVTDVRDALDDVRVVPQDGVVEVAPDQLRQPRRRPGAAHHRHAAVSVGRQLADRQGTEAQMHREVGRPLEGRVVALVRVIIDAGDEIAQQLLRPVAPHRQAQGGKIGRRKAQ